MLRLAALRLPRGLAPLLTPSRSFAAAPVRPAGGTAVTRRQQAIYYARITRKYQEQIGRLSMNTVDRTARFLTNRGLTQTKALLAISRHIMMTCYTPAMMEGKIEWLSDLGLSHDKINDAIVRHPQILGFAFDKFEALVEWYTTHGVPQDKLAYVFTVFPQGVSLTIKSLESKVEVFREVGCNEHQIARILTMAPQMFGLSIERLRANIDYLEELGVHQDILPGIIATVPQCLGLTTTRIKETVDAVDEMFGARAGARALIWNARIVMHNVNGLRRSFNYLLSLGFTKERLELNTRLIMRDTNRILRPRAQFLKRKGVDVVANASWIPMAEKSFIKTYPDYEEYVGEYKARVKKKQS